MNNPRLIKTLSVSEGKISGQSLQCVPSVTGVLDFYDDVIFPGAFTSCLPGFLKRGFCPHDHEWSWVAIVGFPTVAYEIGNKLYSEFTFHSDQASQDALAKCRERLAAGKEVGLSVGFTMSTGNYVEFKSGKALLDYAKSHKYDLKLFDVEGISAHRGPCQAILLIDELFEYSLTPVPANPQAMAIAVKSASGKGRNIYLSAREAAKKASRKPMTIKSICGARGLALASREKAWIASAAIERIKKLTGAVDEPNAEFAKAFAVFSGPADEFSSYHLPFADVVEGQLVAVPKAIAAVASSLHGTSAGPELTQVEKDAAKSFIEPYLLKAAEQFEDPDTYQIPWDIAVSVDNRPVIKAQYLGNYCELSITMSAVSEANWALLDCYADAMLGYGDMNGLDDSEMDDYLSKAHDEHKDLCMSIYRAIKAGMGAETPEEANKSVKRMMLSILSAGGLGSGLSYVKHSDVAVDATRQFIERSNERAEKRLKDKRNLSSGDRAAVQKLRDSLELSMSQLDAILAKTEPKGAKEAEMLNTLALKQLEIKQAKLRNKAA